MFIFPETEKKLKARISSYRTALNKEKKTHHFINDGSGKRYVLFSLYFLLNDLNKSESFFNWYQEYDIWHASNFQNLDYIDDLPEAVSNAITDDERKWMARGVWLTGFSPYQKTVHRNLP